MRWIFILLIFISLPDISKSQAQSNDSLKQYYLGEIVVTDKKEPVIKASSVIEITAQSINSLNAVSIAEALKTSTGVYFMNSSRNEGLINIRGFSQRQIAVYLDGVPIYIPYDGLVDLDQLPTVSIKKITVTKSMPSILYGANGMGGTVNIVTDESIEGLNTSLRSQVGEIKNVSLSGSGVFNKIFWSLGGNYTSSNGYSLPKSSPNLQNEDGGIRDNSRIRKLGSFIKLGVNIGNNTNLALSYYYVDNEKGIPPNAYSSTPRFWRFTEWRKSIFNFMYRTVLSDFLILKGNLFFEGYKNVLDSYDDIHYSTQTKKYAFHSTFDDKTLGSNLSATIITSFLPPTKFGFLYKKDIHREQSNYDKPFAKFEVDVFTFGTEQEIPLSKNLKGVVGLNYDLLKPIYANEAPLRSKSTTLNGHIGFSYDLTENINFHTHVARKSRFPTLKEIYSEVLGKNIANYDLSGEKSLNSEIGLSMIIDPDSEMKLNLFRSDVKDLIQIAPVGSGKQQFQNIGIVLLQGIELEFKNHNSFVNVEANYTYLYSENKTPGSPSKLLEYKPRHMAHLILSSTYDFGLSWSVENSFIGNQYGVDLDTKGWKRMKDYLLVNLKIAQRVFHFSDIFFRLNNLFDKYYETEYGYPQPGRSLIFGLNINFNNKGK